MKPNIKNIVFDLGGVLIDWNPRYLYSKIFRSQEEIDFFLNQVCTSEWNSLQDAGRSFHEAVRSKTLEFPMFEKQIEAFDLRWEEMIGGEISGSVEILKSLCSRKEKRLLALSNWSSEKFPIAQKKFSFLNYFEGILVSGAVGLKKPDPKIFQLLCQNYNILPEESLFIDDVIENIRTAQALNFKTIHFLNPSQLLQELEIL